MSIIGLCGIGFCTVVFVVLLRGRQSEMALLVSSAGAVLILGAALNHIAPSVLYFLRLAQNTTFEPYISVLLKALGISYAVQITADLCRDAGESAVASKVELAGKAEILLLTLPIIEELLHVVQELIV